MENKLLDSTTDERWGQMKLSYKLIKEITNNFNEERILGHGAFGIVYKGVYGNGQEIAVKVLHDNLSGFHGEEFQKELRNLRELKHQNVVELVGYCDELEEVLVEHAGTQVLAHLIHRALCFEFVHNGSLSRHISDECTGLDWHKRYRIIKGICDGLKYLRVGLDPCVWHLDLKPDNILLDDKMIPKIADFGLSRLLGEEKTRRTINALGTCGYWPPEYINYQVISEYFDIYSLGVILVKIMIGSEGYKRIAYMTTGNFVKHVHECWRKMLKPISTPASLEVYCNQVKRSIEIALECLKPNRQERPTIQSIVSRLNETEYMIGDQGLDIQEWPTIQSIVSCLNETESMGGAHRLPIHQVNIDNLHIVDTKLFHRLRFIGDSFKNGDVRLSHHTRSYRISGISYSRGKDHRQYVPYNRKFVLPSEMQRMLSFKYRVNEYLQRYISDHCSALDWHLRYRIIKATALGLKYHHEKLEDAIIDMDLKSSKILLNESLIPKIGDLILSRHEVEKTFVKELRVGSIEYVAPEFIEFQVISKQFDIYSLGVVILETITGTNKYPKSDAMPPEEFVEHVHRIWTKWLQSTMRGTTVERYSHQVKKCIEIALKCVQHERLKRPAIGEIMRMLNETETVELLGVQPPELCFPLDPKKATSCTLYLKNKGEDHVAFMLATKIPMSYWTKLPLFGVVPPRCTYNIALTSRKKLGSKPPSEGVDFITIQSVVVRKLDLQHVGQGTDFYENLFKEAKEMAGDEVQEVKLKAVRDPPAEGMVPELTRSMTIEIISTQNSQQVTSIDVHPTEPWIVTTHHGGSLRFWNYQSMATLNFFEVTDELVHAAKFIAREKWVVVGDASGYILVYSYGERKDVTSFDAHRTSITGLAVHPTRPFVLSSSHDDHLIKLWDWEKDWECIRTFQGHGVTQMTFNSDKTNSFASASSDDTVKMWSVDSDDGKIITLYGRCVGYFMRCDRQHLITGVKDGNAAQIWNLEEDGCVQNLEGHTGHISIVHLHPELPLLIVGSLDGTVSLWNSTTYKIENKIDFNLGAIHAFEYIKGLRRMVVGCQYGIAMVEIPLS